MAYIEVHSPALRASIDEGIDGRMADAAPLNSIRMFVNRGLINALGAMPADRPLQNSWLAGPNSVLNLEARVGGAIFHLDHVTPEFRRVIRTLEFKEQIGFDPQSDATKTAERLFQGLADQSLARLVKASPDFEKLSLVLMAAQVLQLDAKALVSRVAKRLPKGNIYEDYAGEMLDILELAVGYRTGQLQQSDEVGQLRELSSLAAMTVGARNDIFAGRSENRGEGRSRGL